MTPAIDKRKLIELALEAGRRYLSPQTGLIHYCYEKQDASDTIPLFENLCYALTLFRTLVGSLVQEGKERLKHLLAFRTKKGCFPVYLHEYPSGVGSYRTMYPLFLIEKHFHKVIEKPLLSKIRKNLILPLPPEMITSSREAGLMALDLTCRGAPLAPLFHCWDFERDLYIGPLGDERQRKGEMETTLFDLFMGHSFRILKPHPVHLHASLVFPSENGPFAHEKLECIYNQRSNFNLPEAIPIPRDRIGAQGVKDRAPPVVLGSPKVVGKGYHLYRNVWQEGDHLHTLVCQDKALGSMGNVFVYPEIISDEKNRMELTLYTDRAKDKVILINGEKGTVFKLGDLISIKTPENTFTFTFKLLEGKGDFLGHLSFGNRPAQIENDPFIAYDWKIGIRSLRRTSKLHLELVWV